MLDQGIGAGQDAPQSAKASAPALLTDEGKEAADVSQAVLIVHRLMLETIFENKAGWHLLNAAINRLNDRARKAARALQGDEAAAV